MTIKLKLPSLRAVFQYIFLYLFFISHDAAIYRENTMEWRIGIVIFSLIFLTITIGRSKQFKVFVLFIVLVSSYLLIRGERNLWINYIECILLIYVTYNIDKEDFCERFVRMTCFFASISLVFYAVGLLAPNILIDNIPQNNVEWKYYGWPYYLQGRFLYVVRKMELYRNNSIFTEPGLYQMFLNTSLFILLFMNNSIKEIKPKIKNVIIILLIITVLTTGSTTSYISLGMIAFVYIINNREVLLQEKNKRVIRKTFKIITVGMIAVVFILLFDYLKRQNESIIYIFLIKKVMEIFSEGTSGHARTSMIRMSIDVIKRYPIFGAGEDYLSAFIEATDAGANGGILLHTFASIGTIPTLLILYYYFKNLFKPYVPIINALLIIGIYLNVTLAQSRLLYPALLILPIAYQEYCKNQMNCLKNETVSNQ